MKRSVYPVGLAAVLAIGVSFPPHAAVARSLRDTISPMCRELWLSKNAAEQRVREVEEEPRDYPITEVAWRGYLACTNDKLLGPISGIQEAISSSKPSSCSQALEGVARWEQRLADAETMVGMVSSARLQDWRHLWFSSDLPIPDFWSDFATMTVRLEADTLKDRGDNLQKIYEVTEALEAYRSRVFADSCGAQPPPTVRQTQRGPCEDLSGTWRQETTGTTCSSSWRLKRKEALLYSADEDGCGGAKNAKAIHSGKSLTIAWSLGAHCEGHYIWVLNGDCSSGRGKLHWKSKTGPCRGNALDSVVSRTQ